MKKLFILIILTLFALSYSSLFSAKDVVIIYTGNINGSLRDCGCSGEKMGGLARIKAFVDNIRQKNKQTYLIDTGDLFTSYYNPDKSLFLSSIIKDMNYDFIMKSDQTYSSGIGKIIDHNSLHQNNTLFNFQITEKAFEFVPDSLQPKIKSEERIDKNPFLIFHGSKDDYLKTNPKNKKKIVFLSHTQDVVEDYDEESGTYYFQPGMDTEYVGLVYLKELNGNYEVTKHELVKMDSTYSEDVEIKKRIDSFFLHYEYEHTLPNLQTYFYFGADYCQKCHQDSFQSWKESNHAHAYETLKQENRAFDPECLSCHTTGFRQGGFKSLIKTPQFQNVQCESCHVDLPTDHSRVTQRVKIKKVDEETCLSCHTEKNSPNFNFEKYLIQIKHWKDN